MMATKTDFTTEEWSTLSIAPMLVAGVAAMADGKVIQTTIREMKAAAEIIERVVTTPDNSPLLHELLAGYKGASKEDLDAQTREYEAKSVDQAMAVTLGAVDQSLAALEAKATPEEIDAYKGLLTELAQGVAGRTKSGFMGWTGERISSGERAFLDQLAATLAGEHVAHVAETPGETDTAPATASDAPQT